MFLGLKFVSTVGGSVKNNFVNNSITNYNIYYSTIPGTFTSIIVLTWPVNISMKNQIKIKLYFNIVFIGWLGVGSIRFSWNSTISKDDNTIACM